MAHETNGQKLDCDFGEESPVKSLALEIRTIDGHGAPCTFRIDKGTMSAGEFGEKIHKVNDALNSNDDADPSIPTRIAGRRGSGTGRHVYGGSYDYAYIDSIRKEHALNVASKIVRLMHQEEMISYDQMLQAYHDFQLPVQSQINGARGMGRDR